MTDRVTTPDQLHERLTTVAETAGAVVVNVRTRLTTDGAKLYGSVMCAREAYAIDLVTAIRREATAEFGEQGSKLTARREGPHVHVFLPLPTPDARRANAVFQACATPVTEF